MTDAHEAYVKSARDYLAWFKAEGIPGRVTDYVDLTSGRRVMLDDCTDADAVLIAGLLERDIVMPANNTQQGNLT